MAQQQLKSGGGDASGMRLDDLPDALLGAVFAAAGRPQGPAVTLVCRRWRRVWYGEPRLWTHLAISAAPFPGYPRDEAGEQRWQANQAALVGRVARLVHSAALRDGGGHNPLQLGGLVGRLAAAPALADLSLVVYRLTEEALAGLEQLRGLTRLRLHSRALPQPPRRAAAAARLAALPAKLPRLVDLDLVAAELPAELTGSLLALSQLECLALHTLVGPLPPLQPLTALARLRRLALADESFDGSTEPRPLPLPAAFPAMRGFQVDANTGFQVAGVYVNSLCFILDSEPAEQGAAPSGPPTHARLAVGYDQSWAGALPTLLAALLPPGAGVPLRELRLESCCIDEQAPRACPQLEQLRNVDVDSCMSPDMDAALDALLGACGERLTRLRFAAQPLLPSQAAAPQTARPLAFPPRLAGCTALRSLELSCSGGGGFEWPEGAYLAEVKEIISDTFDRLPPPLAGATSLERLVICRQSFQLADADVDAVLARLPALRLLSLPLILPEQAPLLQRLRAAAGPRLRVVSAGRGGAGEAAGWADLLPFEI